MVLRERVEQQIAELHRVQRMLSAAAARIPLHSDTDWWGPAQRLYEHRLADLQREAAAARLALDNAIRETTTARQHLDSAAE